jgi:hypothetical protein
MSNDEPFAWIQEFTGAVTVCDSDGIILAMNDKSILTFQDSGGAALIGSNLFDCHPEPSRTRLKELLGAGRTNVYPPQPTNQRGFSPNTSSKSQSHPLVKKTSRRHAFPSTTGSPLRVFSKSRPYVECP